MSTTGTFTADDLWRILREGAGMDEHIDLKGDGLAMTFEELGYDSVALLETFGRIEREYGLSFEDDAVSRAESPEVLISLVHARMRPA